MLLPVAASRPIPFKNQSIRIVRLAGQNSHFDAAVAPVPTAEPTTAEPLAPTTTTPPPGESVPPPPGESVPVAPPPGE